MYENCRMTVFPKGRSGILANGKEKMDWILASASPRRKELLRELLPSFGVIPARGEERADLSLPPEEVVKRLAAHKAEEVALLPEARGKAVLGADTVVALGGKILGKPKDEAEALCMLKALSGRVHEVFTGVCVILPDGKRSVRAARTEVEFETLSDDVRYEELVTVERNSAGEIRALTSNAYEINRIARDVAYLSQKKLQAMGEEGIEIPLGAFTGIEALAGFGPPVAIELMPVAGVTCRFASDFGSAGINQTRHSVYLEVTAEISVVLPGRKTNFSTSSEVLIAESVLLGDVPEIYIQGDIFGKGYVSQ